MFFYEICRLRRNHRYYKSCEYKLKSNFSQVLWKKISVKETRNTICRRNYMKYIYFSKNHNFLNVWKLWQSPQRSKTEKDPTKKDVTLARISEKFDDIVIRTTEMSLRYIIKTSQRYPNMSETFLGCTLDISMGICHIIKARITRYTSMLDVSRFSALQNLLVQNRDENLRSLHVPTLFITSFTSTHLPTYLQHVRETVFRK